MLYAVLGVAIVQSLCHSAFSKDLTGRVSVFNHKPIIREAPDGRLVNVTYERCVSARPRSVRLRIDGAYDHVFRVTLQSTREWGFVFLIERVDDYRHGASLTIVVVRWRARFNEKNPTKTPCRHNRPCKNTAEGHKCDCGPRYGGKYCQIDYVHCLSSPCRNGGTCSEESNGYSCACANGYTGYNCETKIPRCPSAPCQNGGECIETSDAYRCSCAEGYAGTNCEYQAFSGSHGFKQQFAKRSVVETIIYPSCFTRAPIGAIAKVIGPQRRKGNVTAFDQMTKHSIRVWARPVSKGNWVIEYTLLFDGDFTNDCSGRGTCVNNATQQTCTCDAGFHGTNCEKVIAPCSEGLCQNGGSCSENENGFYCDCIDDFLGETCEKRQIKGWTSVPPNELFCTETRLHEVVYEECHARKALRIDAEILGADRWGFALDVQVRNITDWGFVAETVPKYVGRQAGDRNLMTWNATFEAATYDEKLCLNGGFCHNSRTGRKCHCLHGFTGDRCQTRLGA